MHGSQPKLSCVVESSVSLDLFLGFYHQGFDLQQQSQWSLEKEAKIWGRHHWFPRKMTFGNYCRNFLLATDLSSASDCNHDFLSAHDQSEALPRTGYWHLISMKFLQSFLRRHFTGKPVVVLKNVSCFLRLSDSCSVQLMQGCNAAGCSHVGWHRPQCRPKQLLFS